MQLYKVTSYDGLRNLYVVSTSMDKALQYGQRWAKNDPKGISKIEQLTTHKDVVEIAPEGEA